MLPDGIYPYETYLDHTGGSDPTPLALRLTLSISGSEIHADYSGCPPQVQGPTNLGPAHAWTATYTMTKAFLDPQNLETFGSEEPRQASPIEVEQMRVVQGCTTSQAFADVPQVRDFEEEQPLILRYEGPGTTPLVSVHLDVAGAPVDWRFVRGDVSFPLGQGDLPTLRLGCAFVLPREMLNHADLSTLADE